jgi:hypothetical protein
MLIVTGADMKAMRSGRSGGTGGGKRRSSKESGVRMPPNPAHFPFFSCRRERFRTSDPYRVNAASCVTGEFPTLPR